MSNLPDWWLQALSTGKVNGSGTLPKWFPPKETVTFEEPDTRLGDYDYSVFPTVTRGGPYPAYKIKPQSHYYEPIVDRQWKGNSRYYGDASPEVKDYARTLLISQAKAKGLSIEDTAMVLAIAHHESGFNPDAASNESASGLGQFIDDTGASYKLDDTNRWDIKEQARALVEHYIDNKKLLKDGEGFEMIYAYHHDGSSLAYGGLGIAKKKVMPLYTKYLSVLKKE